MDPADRGDAHPTRSCEASVGANFGLESIEIQVELVLQGSKYDEIAAETLNAALRTSLLDRGGAQAAEVEARKVAKRRALEARTEELRAQSIVTKLSPDG